MHGLTRFLGDTPLRVFIRLLIVSFVVGVILSALNIEPVEVYYWIERLVTRIWNMGFDFFEDAFQYLVIGAIIVVPVFLVMRLLKMGGGRRVD